MKKVLLTLIALLLVVSFAGIIHAQQTSSVMMGVSANVGSTVTVSASSINFAGYNSANESWGQGSITVDAMWGLPLQIAINGGINGPGCPRFLRNATTPDQLAYEIFMPWSASPPMWGALWGDSPYGMTCYPTFMDMGQGAPFTYPVDAVIPAGQPITSAGLYSDVVTVTVYY